MKNLMIVISVLAWLAAAGCTQNHAATAPSVVTPVAQSAAACAFVPLAQPGQAYVFADAPQPVSDSTRCSRFVLYDAGSFELQIGARVAYAGTYAVSDQVVDLRWISQSVAGSWQSDARLDGDTLTVHYNSVMQMNGLEDAIYQLAQSTNIGK